MQHEQQFARESCKSADMVKGSWAEYFRNSGGNWTQETYISKINDFDKFYGNFHEKVLGEPDGQTLLEIGVGVGGTALPLLNRGYKIIGVDNDSEVIAMCKKNVQLTPDSENLRLIETDLYNPNWHEQFENQSIRAVVSYGILEHFHEEALQTLMKQQLKIAPTIIAMMPINTPRSLNAFLATGEYEGDIDKNGIFRRFLTGEQWEEFYKKCGLSIINSYQFSNEKEGKGKWDMIIWALEKQK